jgi:hypothetical protein
LNGRLTSSPVTDVTEEFSSCVVICFFVSSRVQALASQS